VNLSKDFNALVIVGGWNKHIFTLDWANKYLFQGEDLTLDLHIRSPILRISSKNIRILLQENKLSFIPIESSDNNLDRIQDVALQLADYLPHTPVLAYGVNLLFSGTVSNDLKNLIKPEDLTRIKDAGISLNGEKYTRQMVFKGRTLNLTIGVKDPEVTFDFNFHFNISNLVNFKEKIIDAPILELKQDTVDFMTDVYDLEFEEGGSK